MTDGSLPPLSTTLNTSFITTRHTLKYRTASSLKWNLVDRVASQVLYAVTGVVLAILLSEEDFGLVGAVLIFQAFASLLVDSGFSYALLQRKRPSRLDYSTVLWFNLMLATVLYIVLFLCAPLIARCFQNDLRLIGLSRVILLSLIINASAIVPTNRLMKAMSVRRIAVSNAIGLAIGGVTGITLAVTGFGAWAIVWQSLVSAAVKSLVLWTSTSWRPVARFSLTALRSYFGIGSKMMFTSFLNTVFLYINSFLIGNRTGMVALGYYTQADKWSKMGIMSISQTLTSSFMPALSAAQDNRPRYLAMMSKMNRFTAYLLYPAILGLMLMAPQIFHTLFGHKWDASIFLFQLLLFRGIFVILNSLYNNYLLGLGHGTAIVKLEILRDVAAIIALAVTLPYMGIELPGDPVYGIAILLWGQIAATLVTWVATLLTTVRVTGARLGTFVKDNMTYFAQTAIIIPLMSFAAYWVGPAWLKLTVEIVVGLSLYIGGNHFFHSRIQHEVFAFFRGRGTL